MDREPARVALNVEASWNGLVMQSVLVLPGERCRPFVIGDGQDASFPIDPDLMDGMATWTLVEPDGTVRVPPGSRCSSQMDRVSLSRGEVVVIHLESIRFEIRAVSPPRGLRLPIGIDWRALSWASSGVLLSGLAVVVLLHLGPAAMPQGVQQRLDALEAVFLRLAGKADALLARIDLSWPAGVGEPADPGPALPCEPSTVIEVGSTAVVAGAGTGRGFGAAGPGRQGGGRGIDWSSAGPAGAGQEPGSLLGYGMCMLPPVGEEGQE
jgi:hypothetical protein